MYPNHYSSQLLKGLTTSIIAILLSAFIPVEIDAQTATYAANGSDYYVTCSWTGLTSKCCSETKYVKFYRDGVRKKTVNSASNSGSTTVAAGPYTNYRYQWTWGSSGKDNSICVFGCSYDTNLSTGYRVRTANIKTPKSVSAGTDKVGSIKVSWGKGTHIPNGSHGYKIYRDSRTNLVKTVNGSTRSWTDNSVGPGETHTYYVATYTNSWGGHESYAIGTTGSTIPREVTADDGVGESIWVRWESLLLQPSAN